MILSAVSRTLKNFLGHPPRIQPHRGRPPSQARYKGTESGHQGKSLSKKYVNAFGSNPLEAKHFEGVVRNNLVCTLTSHWMISSN